MYPIRITVFVLFFTVLAFTTTEDIYAVGQSAETFFPALQQDSTSPRRQPSTPITDSVSLTSTISTPISLTQTLQLPVLTERLPLTAAQTITAALGITTAEPIAPVEVPQPEAAAPDDLQLDQVYSDILEGTILANRTSANITLFAEGKTYRIAPLRSLGIDLLRATSVANLYSCDADTPQTQPDCYWDPYLLMQNGFYEVFNAAEEGQTIRLKLEEAGAPPQDKIWLQNRTGQREIIVFNGETMEIPASSVQELDVQGDAVATIYRRSCITLGEQTVCEWAPQVVEPGIYYTLDTVSLAGGLPNSQLNAVEAEPLIGRNGPPSIAEASASTATAESAESTEGAGSTVNASASEIVCQLQVPVINVRSGPGLDYLIVTQLVNGGTGADTVLISGRDETGLWLAVNEAVAPGGWITSSGELVSCDGTLTNLPVAEVVDGRLEPTPIAAAPAPVAEAPAAESAEPGSDAGDEEVAGAETAEETAESAEKPPVGQSLLVVTNAFEQPVRFTLSPDEYDLQPGETISVVVNPGRVQFSISSPWRGGISGNAEFLIEPDQTFPMFLYFIPDPNDSSAWEMKYQ